MSGFAHDPWADIAALKRILSDQYDTSSIIKELLQNADDAGAAQLHLAWAPGWPDAHHPLLRGNALVILNDGAFDQSDATAIRYLGLGTKGDEGQAIGRFGLGMKSVFHLSEAILYLASPNQPAADGSSLCRLLNPWHDSGEHKDWEIPDPQDGARLVDWVRSWRHGLSRWFCLWLPLRSEQLLNGVTPIVPRCPRVEEILDPELPARIAAAMPLLRSLDTVAVWQWDPRARSAREEYRLVLNGPSRRCQGPSLPPGQRASIGGEVILQRDGAQRWRLAFGGHETVLDDG